MVNIKRCNFTLNLFKKGYGVEIVGFENLHVHSEYSLLDGLATCSELAIKSKENNQRFLSISDHGMMGAIPRQIKACEEICDKYGKNTLSPIYSIEFYINPMQPESSSLEDLQIFQKDLNEEEKKEFRGSAHLLAIAYNEIGYKNLVRLSSWGWTKGFYRKPRINYEQLIKYKEGIYFTSCCYNSEVGRAFDKGSEELANQVIEKYIEMVGKDHYFLELMMLDFAKQKPYDAFLIKAHEKYGLPLIITNDCLVKDTLILTNRGHKKIQDIQIGDMVLSHKNNFRRVEFLNNRFISSEEKIYRVKAAMGTFAWELTGNHQVRVAKVISKKGKKIIDSFSWKRTDELNQTDYLILPKISSKFIFSDSPLKEINLTNFVSRYRVDSEIEVANKLLLKNDVFISYRGFDRRSTITVPRFLLITEDFLKIIGLYIAEGGLDNQSNLVSFALHIDENEEENLIFRYFGQFGINLTKKVVGNGKVIYFQSVLFREFFEKLCGRGCLNKRFPLINGSVFGNFSKDQFVKIISQYWKGDGAKVSVHERAGNIGSVSKQLIYDLSVILNSLGFPNIPCVNKHENSKHKNPRANPKLWNDCYYISFGSNTRVRLEALLFDSLRLEKPKLRDTGKRYIEFEEGYATKINNVKEINRPNVEVFNLQVEKDESYIANMFQVHNCHYAKAEDSKYQRLMLMIQTGRTLKEIEEAQKEDEFKEFFELQDKNLWLKSEEELNSKWLSDYKDIIPYELFCEAKRNTVRICEKAKGVQLDRSLKLPCLPDADDILKDEVMKGFLSRNLPKNKEYLNRIHEEYSLITRKGFSSYFLIQKMMIDEAKKWCKENLGGDGTQACGPGRGCCFESVLIQLSNGFTKQIKDIIAGDEIVCRDGTFRKVKDTLNYDCNEDLLVIKSYYGDNRGVILTKDHKVLAEKGKRIENYENLPESTKKKIKTIIEPIGESNWYRADELKIGDWVFVPEPKLNINNNIERFDLAEFVNFEEDLSYDEQYVYKDRYSKVCNRFIDIDEDFMKVLGYFAGDGWLEKNSLQHVGFAIFSEDEDILRFFKGYMNKICVDFTPRKQKNKRVISFVVRNIFFANLFRKLFNLYERTLHSKHIPEFVFSLPKNLRLAFLNGYFLADGRHSENKISFSTQSINLGSQVRFLLHSVGLPSSLNYGKRFDKRTNKESFEYVINTISDSRIGFKDAKFSCFYRKVEGGFLTRIRSIEIKKDVKKVYDLSIEGDEHNYLTSSFLTHNSSAGSLICYCLGITQVDPIFEGLLFSRFISENRGGRSLCLEFTDMEPING